MRSAVQFLESIKQRLMAHGWQQFAGGPEEGSNCLLGAAYWEAEKRDKTDGIWDYTEGELLALDLLAPEKKPGRLE